MLTIVRDKRNNASAAADTGHFPVRLKWIVSDDAHSWLCARKRDSPTGYIFDPKVHKVADMANLVKRASSALHWPDGVRWCFHAARHGGDQDIEEAIAPITAQVMAAATTSARKLDKGPAVGDAIAAGMRVISAALMESATQQSASTRRIYLAPLDKRLGS